MQNLRRALRHLRQPGLGGRARRRADPRLEGLEEAVLAGDLGAALQLLKEVRRVYS